MADRKNQGKAQIHFIPREAIEDEAAVFEFGSKKYSVGNWMSPPYFPREVLIDCVLRHAFKMAAGEDIDPESGLPHAGHIRCNMAMYCYQQRYGLFPDGDTGVHADKRQVALNMVPPPTEGPELRIRGDVLARLNALASEGQGR